MSIAAAAMDRLRDAVVQVRDPVQTWIWQDAVDVCCVRWVTSTKLAKRIRRQVRKEVNERRRGHRSNGATERVSGNNRLMSWERRQLRLHCGQYIV